MWSMIIAILLILGGAYSFVNQRKMKKSLGNLSDFSQELAKTNNILRKSHEMIAKKCDDLLEANKKLISRVEYLEEENRKINITLENLKIMAPNFKIDKGFTMKLVK